MNIRPDSADVTQSWASLWMCVSGEPGADSLALLRLMLPTILRSSKDPRDSLSRCKNEVTMCFRRNHYSSRNASIGKFVVQWWQHSKLKPFGAFRKGAVEILGNPRVNLVRRCVAYKNFPILEMRTMMGMDSSGHLQDKASSKTLRKPLSA